jgi:hypothetical protein
VSKYLTNNLEERFMGAHNFRSFSSQSLAVLIHSGGSEWQWLLTSQWKGSRGRKELKNRYNVKNHILITYFLQLGFMSLKFPLSPKMAQPAGNKHSTPEPLGHIQTITVFE